MPHLHSVTARTARRAAGLVLALAAAGLPGLSTGARAAGAPASAWTTDFNQARELSRKTHKPLLMEFYALWCGPCKLMATTTFKDAKVKGLLTKFVLLRVDVDRYPALASKYSATAIPRTVILSPAGKVARSTEGYHDANDFALFLKQSL